MLWFFGLKVFFGDVLCLDFLYVVGIEEVKFLVIVIDNKEQIIQMVYYVSLIYFNVYIIVWVIDCIYVYDFYVVGCCDIICDVFDSLVCVGWLVFEVMGMYLFDVEKVVQEFVNDDCCLLVEMVEVYDLVILNYLNEFLVIKIKEIIEEMDVKIYGLGYVFNFCLDWGWMLLNLKDVKVIEDENS